MLRDDPNPPRGTLPTRGAFRAAAVRSGGPTYRTTMGIRGPSSRREEGRRSQRRRRGPRADYRRCGRAAHDPRDGDDHVPRPPGDSVAAGLACRCLHPAHLRPHESGQVDRPRRGGSCASRAEAEGAFDAILLNEKGRVVETTARNVFLVSDGSLQTPPIYEGALPGITRSAVLEIAARAKIRAREMFVSLDRLRGADEVFLSGSGVGVLSITSVDGRRMEAPGPATRTIQDGYATMLDAEAKW